MFASRPKEDKGKDKGNKGDKTDNKGNSEDKADKNDKDKGNGDNKDKGNNGEKSKDNADYKNGNDKEKIKDNNGKGNTKEHTNNKDKKKVKENRGKHLGWYKRKNHQKYPGDTGGAQPGTGTDTGTSTTTGGEELTKPEVFEVTNYINDINRENTEVLMTTDVNGDYWAAYTYGLERIGVEDLMEVEGKPNNPLYYLQDANNTKYRFNPITGKLYDELGNLAPNKVQKVLENKNVQKAINKGLQILGEGKYFK